jgi:hypothetical protein
MIADCQLPIFDWRLAIKPIGNRKSEIENPMAHPLPQRGTDLMSLQQERLNDSPARASARSPLRESVFRALWIATVVQYRDVDAGRFVTESWAEHLRQHERVTAKDPKPSNAPAHKD